MNTSNFNIAVLGAGNIGSTVIERLFNMDNELLDITVKKVLVSDVNKDRSIDKGLLTDNIDDIINDKDIDVVIEVLGGIDPGKEYIKSLLSTGKSVITANKDIIADCGKELIELAPVSYTHLTLPTKRIV